MIIIRCPITGNYVAELHGHIAIASSQAAAIRQAWASYEAEISSLATASVA